MINLAGNKGCDKYIKRELQRSKIEPFICTPKVIKYANTNDYDSVDSCSRGTVATPPEEVEVNKRKYVIVRCNCVKNDVKPKSKEDNPN